MANLDGANGSFLVLFKDDSRKEVFLIFRNDYPLWVLTGGGIEHGETPEAAVIREMNEETGFKFSQPNYLGRYEFPNGRITHLFDGHYLSGDYKPEYKGNIGRWFPVDDLPPDVTSATKRKIIDALAFHGTPFINQFDDELPLSENLGLMFRHPLAFIKFINNKIINKPRK